MVACLPFAHHYTHMSTGDRVHLDIEAAYHDLNRSALHHWHGHRLASSRWQLLALDSALGPNPSKSNETVSGSHPGAQVPGIGVDSWRTRATVADGTGRQLPWLHGVQTLGNPGDAVPA